MQNFKTLRHALLGDLLESWREERERNNTYFNGHFTVCTATLGPKSIEIRWCTYFTFTKSWFRSLMTFCMWGQSNWWLFLIASLRFSQQSNLVQKLVSSPVSYKSDFTRTKHLWSCQYWTENTPSPKYTVGCLLGLAGLVFPEITPLAGTFPPSLITAWPPSLITAWHSGHTITLLVNWNVQEGFGHFLRLGIWK